MYSFDSNRVNLELAFKDCFIVCARVESSSFWFSGTLYSIKLHLVEQFSKSSTFSSRADTTFCSSVTSSTHLKIFMFRTSRFSSFFFVSCSESIFFDLCDVVCS